MGLVLDHLESALAVHISVRMTGSEVPCTVLGLVLHTDPDPLADLLALELGDTLHDVHDETSHGGGGVELVLHGVEFLPLLTQVVHHQCEVHTVPVDTVHLHDKEDIPLVGFLHHPVVLGTVVGTT